MQIFGKKNSNLLRMKLMKIMAEEDLKKAVFQIYSVHKFMNNKKRILGSKDFLPEAISAAKGWTEAMDFIESFICQWVDDEDMENFASIHVPATNPPLTILAAVMSSNHMKVTQAVKYVMADQTFG